MHSQSMLNRSRPLLAVSIFHRLRSVNLLWILCFCAFLLPITIGQFSVNYSFLLFPLLAVGIGGNLRKPDNAYLLFIAFYSLIFAIAAFVQVGLVNEFPRRAASFVLFMSIFVFTFVRIQAGTVEAFKTALIISAVCSCLAVLFAYFYVGGSSLDSELAKTIVGSQRYGFIYILAFWLIALSTPKRIWGEMFKFFGLVLVLLGAALTFSRATIIGLASSIALGIVVFTVRFAMGYVSVSPTQLAKRLALVVLAFGVTLLLMDALFSSVLEFYHARIVVFLSTPGAIEANLVNPAAPDGAGTYTSGGTRIYIWSNIVKFVAQNPSMGSGYLGVWILNLFGHWSGSAHNQYLDVLFRVGVIGFIIYVYLLYRIVRCLHYSYPALCWGFIGVLVYGIFHETFKESHGAFVLAFLLGAMSQVASAGGSSTARTTSRDLAAKCASLLRQTSRGWRHS
jgi:O-antigen ligase